MTRAPLAALLALASVSCGAPLMKLPAGPGAPSPDALQALDAATSTCRATSTLTAEAAVSGSIAGQRVRARLVLGLSAPASARLEAFAVGRRMFTFVSVNEIATLLLDQEGGTLERAPADAVMEALTGLPLGSGDLRAVLTGCASVSAPAEGSQLGPDWRRVNHRGSSYFLHRERASAPWELVAADHRQPLTWRAEYRGFRAGLPRDIVLRAADRDRFDLRLLVEQVDVNGPLGPEVFQVTIPPSFASMSLDELRRLGPFGAGRSR